MKRLSLTLAIIALAAVLAVGVPLFVRTPVWVDVTYHDLSAWNVLHGGVHYRDVFETNLPGMVWLHCLVRPVVGWSHEAIRVVDLLVIGSVLLILMRLMRQVRGSNGRVSRFPSAPVSGGEGIGVRGVRLAEASSTPDPPGFSPSPPAPLPPERGERGDRLPSTVSATQGVWFLVAGALFYLFETEFIHCQRDGWMLLPAVGATAWRVARIAKPRAAYWAVGEGLLWGLAVWIKPHVLVPALLVWLASLRFQTRRGAVFDALALVGGGLLAGAAGSIWLVRTGAWSPMWDVLRNWNPEYYTWSWDELWFKVRVVPGYFAPFSLLHFVAVPVGVVALVRRDPARAALAALYIGWLAQATLIQKVFDYAHAPPTLLGLAVLAAHRWPVGPVFLAWCVAAGLINEVAGQNRPLTDLRASHPLTVQAVLPHHPVVHRKRLAHWSRCWHDGSWELKDRLTFYPYIHCSPHWADLDRVAAFLRSKNVGHGDLICWHDSTHPLYVELGVRPALRFPHVMTAMKFRSKLDVIRHEAFTSGAKYAVSDLVPVSYLVRDPPFGPAPPPGPTTELPAEFPAWRKDVYPWNQPVVFRAGRYFVHEITNPHGEIDFPLPEGLRD